MLQWTDTRWTTFYILIADAILSGYVLETLRRGKASGRLCGGVGFFLLAGLSFLVWRLSKQNLFPSDISPGSLTFILFGFVAALCLVSSLVKPLRIVLLNLPHENLLLPQGLRIFFGVGFLVEGVLGILPRGFSIADGLLHSTSAFLALQAGLLQAQHPGRLGKIWFANLFGMTDIALVALGIPWALLAHVGPNHNIMYAAFFAAPLFVVFHFFSLWKLIIGEKRNV